MNKSTTTKIVVLTLVLWGLGVPMLTISGTTSIMITATECSSCTAQIIIEHDPVIIYDEANFAQQGWSGSGTIEDPYVIENILVIDDTVSYGISITNVNVHVLIRNCKIEMGADVGIWIRDVASIVLEDVIVIGPDEGVNINAQLSANITGCSISECDSTGIVVSDTLLAYMTDVNVSDCQVGISLEPTLFILEMINIIRCSIGIDAPAAYACYITDSYFSECTVYSIRMTGMATGIYESEFNDGGGLLLGDSTWMIIANNTFTNSGLVIEGSTELHWYHTIISNSVNGRPLGYFYADSNLELTNLDYGQLIIAVVDGLSIVDWSVEDSSLGLILWQVDNGHIENIEIEGCQTGMKLSDCESVILDNCSVIEGGNGIWISDCSEVELVNSTILDNDGYGVRLDTSTTNCVVHNCVFSSNEDGLIDDGTSNTWDNNEYSDYDGSGFYTVPGTAGSIDSNPMAYSSGDALNLILVVVIGLGAVIGVGAILLYKWKKS